MREVTLYVAEDGKNFYDEEECIKYEHSQIIPNIYVRAFDQNFEEIFLEDDFEKVADKACYLKFENQKSKERFEELGDYYGCCTVGLSFSNVLNFYWDDDTFTWKDLDEKINSMKDFIQKCENCGLA